MPRKKGDFRKNDDIYIEVCYQQAPMVVHLIGQIEKEERKRRSEEDMAQEAAHLATFFPDNQQQFSLFLEE
jgi:hypothetical protein